MGNKIAFMGVGAVGGYAGAHMAQAGEDVTFIDPWPAHVEKIQRDGLKISHLRDVPEFTAKVRAMHVTDAQQLAKEQPIDIAFVCMKSYDTQWAATLISQYLAPGGYIVSLQNCMNEETIAGVVGWGKTVGCIASSITVARLIPGRTKRSPGVVRRPSCTRKMLLPWPSARLPLTSSNTAHASGFCAFTSRSARTRFRY